MATLGQPEKIVYISKGLVSGVSNIRAFIMKPNGDIVGPFFPTEETDNNFKGFYSFVFNTDKLVDSNGTYVGVFVSPNEGVRAPFKVVYDEISIGEVNEIIGSITQVIKQLNLADIEVTTDDIEEISVEMGDN